jgi:predicted GNAT family acetyltransferase
MGRGDVYLWQDERPVSMAQTSRPTRNGISVSFVYTPPALRRRGYATACVAELSRLLVASRYDYCTLFADLANDSANRMYRRIGYQPACDCNEYAFHVET